MLDTVHLSINGYLVENFTSYSIDADIYTPDDAFSMELSNPETDVSAGMECELYVNNDLELTGVIDKVVSSYSKAGKKLSISGRDLMGQVMDQYVNEPISLEGLTLKVLAERLLAKVPLVKRKTVQYQEDVANEIGRLRADGRRIGVADTSMSFCHIEKGMKVGEVLMEYAKSRGVLFFSLPDGTFVFGTPACGGQAVFSLTATTDVVMEVLSGEKTEDFSKRYKNVYVVGQRQGQAGNPPVAVNYSYVSTDPDFPLDRTFVHKDDYGGDNPQLLADMLMQKMKHNSFRLVYKLPGHSKDNKNWAINELCTVRDDLLELHDDYLIYGRTFTRSKDEGTLTTLRLGYPGLMV